MIRRWPPWEYLCRHENKKFKKNLTNIKMQQVTKNERIYKLKWPCESQNWSSPDRELVATIILLCPFLGNTCTMTNSLLDPLLLCSIVHSIVYYSAMIPLGDGWVIDIFHHFSLIILHRTRALVANQEGEFDN